MTEAVSLGELLHEVALFVLTGVRKVGVPRGRLFPSGLCLSAISLVVCAWPDPLPTGLNGDGKNVQTLCVGGARSITLYDACTPSSAYQPSPRIILLPIPAKVWEHMTSGNGIPQ